MTRLPPTPPDHLSVEPRSRFFDAKALESGIGVRFKGVERTDVLEYCISEGWIRVQAGRSNDRHGNPMTIKLNGPVETWFASATPEPAGDDADSESE